MWHVMHSTEASPPAQHAQHGATTRCAPVKYTAQYVAHRARHSGTRHAPVKLAAQCGAHHAQHGATRHVPVKHTVQCVAHHAQHGAATRHAPVKLATQHVAYHLQHGAITSTACTARCCHQARTSRTYSSVCDKSCTARRRRHQHSMHSTASPPGATRRAPVKHTAQYVACGGDIRKLSRICIFHMRAPIIPSIIAAAVAAAVAPAAHTAAGSATSAFVRAVRLGVRRLRIVFLSAPHCLPDHRVPAAQGCLVAYGINGMVTSCQKHALHNAAQAETRMARRSCD